IPVQVRAPRRGAADHVVPGQPGGSRCGRGGAVRQARWLVVAVSALLLVGTASAAAPVQLVESGGAQFPFRSYVLTLAKARALSAANVHVTENGTPVRGLSVISAQAAKARQFGVVLAIDASHGMEGEPVAA